MAEKNNKTKEKLIELGKTALEQLRKKENPSMDIPLRSLSNTVFDAKEGIVKLGNGKQTRYFLNLAHAKKFIQTFLIAQECKKLIEMGKTTSIRDLYYAAKHTIVDSKENTFEDQTESDDIIEDLEVSLDALREELNLKASNRGAMVGNITIVDSGDEIDCRHLGSGGWSIPSIVEDPIIKFKKVDADFILMVEKDAVWGRLNEDKFWKKHNCILIHGQGMAPRGTRRLLYRLNKEHNLPVYVFVDNDPWGFYIYSVIKQGSINLAYESMRMAVPKARFLGLSSFDQEKYDLPKNVTIKLDQTDINRANQVLKYEWFQKPSWQKEIKHMLEKGVKLELEALSAKGISYVTDTYLPEKIKNKEWLE